jgi:hypothetical protein
MHEGDRSRKQTLVDFGFRLPSALDNRPLRFDEFLDKVKQMVFVSATPGPFELRHSTRIAEQLIRPTGIVDPDVELRATKNQIDDLLNEIRRREEVGERTLVTTLTKKMAASSGSASTTSSSASTCCARASTCPRSHSSRSSMRTRRASCAGRPPSSRRSAARRGTRTARC